MDLRTLGRRRRRHGSASTKMALLYCLIICLLIYISALFTSSAHSDVGSLTSASHSQEGEEESSLAGGGRRGLSGGGPGSYPPLCTTKCGDCTPCNPVHVAVPPGRPVIAEYYPEAWRCKCGNKLYMP